MLFKRRGQRLLALQEANQVVTQFLAIEDVAAATNFIASHPQVLEKEFDKTLRTLVAVYRVRDETQQMIMENVRGLFRRCREIGVDAALAERAYLFRYGTPDDDVEGQRKLASELLGQEALLPPEGVSEMLSAIPPEMHEFLDPATLAMMRYARTGAVGDLNDAVAAWTGLLEHPALASAPEFFQLSVLNDLGTVLFLRYQLTSRREDLDRSIEYLQRAVDATPKDFHERPNYVSNLANALRERAALKSGSNG